MEKLDNILISSFLAKKSDVGFYEIDPKFKYFPDVTLYFNVIKNDLDLVCNFTLIFESQSDHTFRYSIEILPSEFSTQESFISKLHAAISNAHSWLKKEYNYRQLAKQQLTLF